MRAGSVEHRSGRWVFALAAAAALGLGGLVAPSPAQADGEPVDDLELGEESKLGNKDFSGQALSPKEKLGFAESAASDLNDSIQRVLSLVTDAQQRKDVILLNCLNDKLIALRGLLKVAQDGELNLSEAVARENSDLQEHNYRKVAIAADQAQLIMAEADACTATFGSSQSGETVVSVTVEGDRAEADEGFGAASTSSTRPADSSPSN